MCNCKKRNIVVSEEDALRIVENHFIFDKPITNGEKNLLYLFHNQNYNTSYEYYCVHCWDIIKTNLVERWTKKNLEKEQK